MDNLQSSDSHSSYLLPSSAASPSPYVLPICRESWLMAEKRVQEILLTIQPTTTSEEKRKDIIGHVQKLIRGYYGPEVFPFGSMPLRTYIPDGDIDLTILCHQNLEDDLARGVCNIFEGRERDSEYPIKDVRYVNAQVKIVKFSVKGLPVDLSFNQLAGLGTLCFLEKVDQLIGKDHLFKRSILLIKAWCYYESRILGAHHGLVAAYGLEIMVLYIINLFHSSLNGPLEVLYRFLVYYSTFDWDNYCISICGPVAKASLSNTTDQLNDIGDELLIGKDFLADSKAMFSSPTTTSDGKVVGFLMKNLNILDPLKDDNNLGRSVSKGNFNRVKLAIAQSAERLGNILLLPGEKMGQQIEEFFENTLDRNGRGQRPDVLAPVPAFGTGRFEVADLTGDYDLFYSILLYGQWHYDYTSTIPKPSLPLSPQLRKIYSWSPLARLAANNQAGTSRRGTDVFIPSPRFYPQNRTQSQVASPHTEEIGKSGGSPSGTEEIGKSRGASSGTEEIGRSRGAYTSTGQVSHHFSTRMYGRPLSKGAESSSNGRTTEMNKHDDVTKRDEDEAERSFDLVMEDFPLLPKSRLPETDQSKQLKTAFATSPFSQVTAEAKVHEESTKLVRPISSVGGEPSTTKLRVPMEPTGNSNEMHIAPAYVLEDKDFPPLSS